MRSKQNIEAVSGDEKKDFPEKKDQMVSVRRIPGGKIFKYNSEIASRLIKKGVGELVEVEIKVKSENPKDEKVSGGPPPRPKEQDKDIL